MDAEAWQMENVSFERFSEGSLPFHKLIALCDVVVAHFESLVMFTCFNGSMGESGQREERSRLRGIALSASTTFLSLIEVCMISREVSAYA